MSHISPVLRDSFKETITTAEETLQDTFRAFFKLTTQMDFLNIEHVAGVIEDSLISAQKDREVVSTTILDLTTDGVITLDEAYIMGNLIHSALLAERALTHLSSN